MEDADQAQQERSRALPEMAEDAASSEDTTPSSSLAPGLSLEEREELQGELAKVEDEIQTLTHVLAVKEKQLADIKRKLGITPLNELKQNFNKGWQEVTTSNAYRRTSESLSLAGQRASAVFSNMGSAISRKFEDVKNKPSFKSFEERVGTLKTKMSPSASDGDHDDQDASNPDPGPLSSQHDNVAMQEPPTH